MRHPLQDIFYWYEEPESYPAPSHEDREALRAHLLGSEPDVVDVHRVSAISDSTFDFELRVSGLVVGSLALEVQDGDWEWSLRVGGPLGEDVVIRRLEQPAPAQAAVLLSDFAAIDAEARVTTANKLREWARVTPTR